MKKLFLLPALLIGTLAFTACEKWDDDNIRVSHEFESAFWELYPQASRVHWEREFTYYVADFWRNDLRAEAEAWFDEGARWTMTVSEIGYAGLPMDVKTAFSKGEYGSWRVEDVDMVERNGRETVYILEIEQGERELDLYYTGDGAMVKDSQNGTGAGDNNPADYLPAEPSTSTLEAYVAANYPGARIVEIDRETNAIQVDILDGRTHRELTFSLTEEWLSTKTEIILADVPEAVMEVFNRSPYSTYRIDDIDLIQTPEAEYYLFELNDEPEDIHYKIYPSGIAQ